MWPFSPSCCVASSRAENLLAESPPRCNSFRMAVADPQSRRELWGMSLWVATSRSLPPSATVVLFGTLLPHLFLPSFILFFSQTFLCASLHPAILPSSRPPLLHPGPCSLALERHWVGGDTGPALKECVFSREATPVTKSPQRSLLGTGTDVSAGPSGAGRAVRVHLGWPGACFAGESLGWSLGGWRGSCGPWWAGERRQR